MASFSVSSNELVTDLEYLARSSLVVGQEAIIFGLNEKMRGRPARMETSLGEKITQYLVCVRANGKVSLMGEVRCDEEWKE